MESVTERLLKKEKEMEMDDQRPSQLVMVILQRKEVNLPVTIVESLVISSETVKS